MGVGLDQPSHWVIIAVLAMLLFGYKKMPDMARSAGRSLRIFKTEMKGMADDDDARTAERDAPAALTPGATATAVPVVPVAVTDASTATVKSTPPPAAG